MRKYHARFLEGWATARSPGYSAVCRSTCPRCRLLAHDTDRVHALYNRAGQGVGSAIDGRPIAFLRRGRHQGRPTARRKNKEGKSWDMPKATINSMLPALGAARDFVLGRLGSVSSRVSLNRVSVANQFGGCSGISIPSGGTVQCRFEFSSAIGTKIIRCRRLSPRC